MGWLNEQEKKLIEAFSKVDVTQKRYLSDFLTVCDAIIKRDYSNRQYILSKTAQVKQYCQKKVFELGNSQEIDDIKEGQRLFNVYWQVLLMEAQNKQLDSYLLYVEKNREPSEKFYQPKRKQFLQIGVIQALQKMIDDELDVLSISLPPGTGKTTLEKFFNSAVIGWFPDGYNLFFSHSSDITRMYYDGVLNICTDDMEYAWHDVFPRLKIRDTNAKRTQFNVGKYKPFPSLQCTSVGAENAGKVRCSKFLLVDDMIGGIEEALNKNTLDKLWNIYSVDARQRKVEGCKEIHIATRWSVHDVIGRLQANYGGNKRCLFIAVPDIDPRTGKSNFNYDYNGFSEAFYHDQSLLMDDVSYRCLYKNEPIEREGLLYQEDELRRYLSLPEREPDAILGVCDTKEKGTDFMFMPIFYKYDNDYYFVDCVCDDNADFGVQYGRITSKLLEHNVQQMEFEANQGGQRIAFEIDKMVKEQGGRCNITTKHTETNKETKIIVNADWIKRNVLFRDKENYERKSDYGVAMSFLLSYSVAGRNKHDDVPDGMANFALYVSNKLVRRETRIYRGGIL